MSWAAVGNEVDNARLPMTMSPQQAAVVYSELARAIRARRLGARLILGDNTGWGQSLEYVRQQLGAPGVRSAVQAVASHPYTGSDAERLAFRALARRARLPVWMTEWTSGCPCG